MNEQTEYPLLEKVNPSTCISGNMMKCNRIIANIFRKHLKPFGITDSQLSILFLATKAKEVNQKKLADRLFMEKSTVNRNIGRLVSNGYLSKDQHMFLHTTVKGKQLLEEVLPHWELAMAETRKALGQDGTEALSIILNNLIR